REGVEHPQLHKLCNAIRTLDLALSESESTLCRRLSHGAWSRIRDDCFDILVSSFAGYFLVYQDGSAYPKESGSKWPAKGMLEFYPGGAKRRDDAYHAELSRVDPAIMTRLRWCFAEMRQHTTPSDFHSYWQALNEHTSQEEADEAHHVLTALYEACL